SCPAGYACNAMGVCAGGSATGLQLDVKSFTVSGTVTLNGASPVSNNSNCPTSAASYGRGSVHFYDEAKGYSFAFPITGCTNTAAAFTGSVFPGTYLATGSCSDPSRPAGYEGDALAVCAGGEARGLPLDVKSFTVSGTVTLNGSSPVSNN